MSLVFTLPSSLLCYKWPLLRTGRHDTASVLNFWYSTLPLRAVPVAAAGIKQPIHADLWRISDHPQSNSTSG